MDPLLPAILPVAAIVSIGFLAGRMLSWEHQTLSQLSTYILAPALVADGLYRTALSPSSAAGLLVGFACVSLLLYGGIGGLSRLLRLPPDTQKSLMATTLLPNNGYLGLPLIAFALGPAGLERAIIYTIGSSILMFGIFPALLEGSGLGRGLRLTFKLPLIWAMLAGASLHAFRIPLPLPLDEAMEQLGQAAIPVALLVLGMQLADTQLRVGHYEIAATAIRLLVAPSIAGAVGALLHLTGLDWQVLVLQSAMPAAVNTVVLVTEFGGDGPRVARTIVVTTLLSFLTLPAILEMSARF